MTTESSGPETDTILPADTPSIRVIADSVSRLSERFYNLFNDVRPQGQSDLVYFHGLMTDFGGHLDVAEELMRFQAWALDQGDGTPQNPRRSFRDWLRRTSSYRRGDGNGRRTRR